MSIAAVNAEGGGGPGTAGQTFSAEFWVHRWWIQSNSARLSNWKNYLTGEIVPASGIVLGERGTNWATAYVGPWVSTSTGLVTYGQLQAASGAVGLQQTFGYTPSRVTLDTVDYGWVLCSTSLGGVERGSIINVSGDHLPDSQVPVTHFPTRAYWPNPRTASFTKTERVYDPEPLLVVPKRSLWRRIAGV